MTTQEILEGNKLIAEYMGAKRKEYSITNREHYLFRDGRKYLTENLIFHSSWDWLMPVVEKIESLPTDKENGEEFQFSITGDGIAITQYDDGSGIIASRVNYLGKSKLEFTFEVVVEFIKWHTNEVKEGEE